MQQGDWPASTVETWAIGRLVPYANNARTHSEGQIEQIAAAIREWGWTIPVLADEAGGVIAGHGRIAAARRLGIVEVPVLVARGWTDAQKRAYVIADNKLALNAGWDDALLTAEMEALKGEGFDLQTIGFSADELAGLFGTNSNGAASTTSLAERFLVPPFSLLNAREGWWQDRKRAWIALGIKSELGRGAMALMGSEHVAGDGLNYCRDRAAPGGSARPVADYSNRERGDGAGRPVYGTEGNASEQSGTSIFDPVLCEIAYRWFCPAGGLVLDPFAGGSVRGIVAGKLGRRYLGADLRPEQIEANRTQGRAILDAACGRLDPLPGILDAYPAESVAAPAPPVAWICSDSRSVDWDGAAADFVFTSPPYADLEVYSDNPADLSTMQYPDFLAAYREIVARACAQLQPDRFACVVVGEVRDAAGNYRDFIGDTVQAFRDAGLAFYNEAILLTAVGSLPIRAAKQFSGSRKLGKTHQNVLVFVKGDARAATAACGPVDVALDALIEDPEGGA